MRQLSEFFSRDITGGVFTVAARSVENVLTILEENQRRVFDRRLIKRARRPAT